jgi:hypothetical protein
MGTSRIRVFMAILLLDAGLCPILLASDDSGLHWAEGIYFPPVIPQAGATRNATRYGGVPNNTPRYSSRSNPWAAPGKDGIYRQPQTLESLGYPSDQYDPYRSSQPAADSLPYRVPAPAVSPHPQPTNPYLPRSDYPSPEVEIYHYGTQPPRRAQPSQPNEAQQGAPAFKAQPSLSPYGLDNEAWPPLSYSPYDSKDRASRYRGYRMPESDLPSSYPLEYGSRYYDPSYRADRYTPHWGEDNYWNEFILGIHPFPGMWPSLSIDHYYLP